MTDAVPKVTVVIPTYNRETLLREAVASVLAQTYRAFELVVVDDGSTDATRGFLESIHDERVKVVLSEHTGNPAKLRNLGVAASSAEWVAFLDSDDTWAPTKLERQLELLAAQPGYEWTFTDFRRIDESGIEQSGLRRLPIKSGQILRALIDGSTGIALPTVMLSRRLFEESGRFDESFIICQDFELWIRLASRWPALGIPEPLAAIRAHPGNARPWRSEVFENLVRIYQAVSITATDPAVGRIAGKRRAWSLIQLSGLNRLQGKYGMAFRFALAGVVADPGTIGSWLGLAKALVHPLAPRQVLRRYYRVT